MELKLHGITTNEINKLKVVVKAYIYENVAGMRNELCSYFNLD